MARSLLELLTAAGSTDGGPIDTSDHPFADFSGSDVAFVLELGWSTLPPAVAERLQPPTDMSPDLDADAADVLHAVLAGPSAIDDPGTDLVGGLVADMVLDTAWGTGTVELLATDDDADDGDGDVADHEVDDHDGVPTLDLSDLWASPALADHEPLTPDLDDTETDDADSGLDGLDDLD
jgi:hypothetical protein